MEQKLIKEWNSLKDLILEMEENIVKSSKGNSAAGLRARKQIKQAVQSLKELRKISLELKNNKE